MRKKTKVLNAASSGFLQLTIINTAGSTHHSKVTAISWKELSSGTNMAIRAVQTPMMMANTMVLRQDISSPPKILRSVLINLFSDFCAFFLVIPILLHSFCGEKKPPRRVAVERSSSQRVLSRSSSVIGVPSGFSTIAKPHCQPVVYLMYIQPVVWSTK